MDLGKYLKNRDFIFFLCTGAFATQVILISDVITTSIIIPIIDKKFFNNSIQKNNVENLKNIGLINNPNSEIKNISLIVEKNNIKFDIGKIIHAILRLIIVIIILRIIYKLTI
jgi:hypothetical protein